MPTEYFHGLLMRHCCVWLATALSFIIIVGHSHDAGAGSKPSLELRRHLTEIAKLAQQREFAARWLVGGDLLHDLPCGRSTHPKPTSFSQPFPKPINPVGRL